MEQPLLALTEIPDEGSVTVDFFGREVLVYLVDGQPRATANVCSHLGGPLERCDGEHAIYCDHLGLPEDAALALHAVPPARELAAQALQHLQIGPERDRALAWAASGRPGATTLRARIRRLPLTVDRSAGFRPHDRNFRRRRLSVFRRRPHQPERVVRCSPDIENGRLQMSSGKNTP